VSLPPIRTPGNATKPLDPRRILHTGKERGNLLRTRWSQVGPAPRGAYDPRARRPVASGRNHMDSERASAGGRHLAQRRRRPTALLAAACILLVMALGIGGYVLFVNTPGQSLACRSGNLPLHVVVSPDQAGVVTQAAAEYERRRPAVDDRCVDVQVRGTDSVEAATALSTGWDETAQGPRPDVWVPASSVWALQVALRQQASRQAVLIPLEYPKVATSPMVMAMPKPMAAALGWPRQTLGFEQLLGAVTNPEGWKALGHPEWGAFKLGKTDPNLSTPGLQALIAAVFTATGQTSELSVETLVRQEDQVRRVILGLERAPGQDADTPATLLANLQQADQAGRALDFVSVVPLDEKSVWDYNRGNVGGLEDGGEGDKPEVPLVAVYPKEGTLEADHPWVVLRAPWVDEAKRRAAAGFLDYLRSEPIQARFQEAGFRTSEGRAGPQLTQANGLLPDQPTRVLAPPAPKVVAAALESWNAARKRSNVLAVYDVSGSMKEEVPGTGGKTKMDIVKAAAGQALGLFAPETNLGTWIFSSDLAGGRDWAESVPIGPTNARLPNGKSRRQVLAEALANLQATNGDTGLYDTTLAAFRAVQRSYAPQRINIVVLLTDGINDDPTGGISRAELLRRLKAEQKKDRPVRIITIAYGANADAESLRLIAKATGGLAYVSRDPADILRVFTDAITKLPAR
jgi:Ca-activated chloride channel family protein